MYALQRVLSELKMWPDDLNPAEDPEPNWFWAFVLGAPHDARHYKGDEMLLDAAGNAVQPENNEEEQEVKEIELHSFSPDVLMKSLSGQMVCRCVALIQLGPAAPEEKIEETAQKFWNYGINEGIRKSGDVSHVFYARQALKDFLVTADYIYNMLVEYEEPEEQEEPEIAPEEDAADDGE